MKTGKLIWVAFFNKPTRSEVNEELQRGNVKRAYLFTDNIGCYTLRPFGKRAGLGETFKKIVSII